MLPQVGTLTSDKGLVIPTISQNQLSATICQWFGISEADVEATLFPNLTNSPIKYLNLLSS